MITFCTQKAIFNCILYFATKSQVPKIVSKFEKQFGIQAAESFTKTDHFLNSFKKKLNYNHQQMPRFIYLTRMAAKKSPCFAL